MRNNLIGSIGANLYQVAHHKYFLPICFITAFIIRLGWINLLDVQPVSDFRWYYERGIDFAAGHGYSVGPNAFWPENIPPRTLESSRANLEGRSLTAYWPVGYPAFLGLLFTILGPSLFVAKIANVVLSTGVLFFSFYIAKTLFSSELTGRVVLLILALYPDHIAYSSLLASETLFLFLLLLGVALLIVPRPGTRCAFAAGIIFGLACLVKPQVILVPAILFTVSLATNLTRKSLRDQLKLASVLYLALGLTILPWLLRNYQVFNNFVFISNNGGYNLLVGNNPDATGAYVFNEQLVSGLSDVSGEYERDRKAFKMAGEYLVNHPLETVKLWPKKLWYLYGRDTKGISWNVEGLKSTPSRMGQTFLSWLEPLAQLYYMAVGAGFLLSIFFLLQKSKKQIKVQPFPTLGLWIVLYFTFISLITFGNSRFHFPMIPWLVMYVGAFVANIIAFEQKSETLTGNTARRFEWN